MEFPAYQYLWPPRPEKAIPPVMLHLYESLGWHAQIKMNGTCNVIAVSPGGEIKAMKRDQGEHTAWSPDSTKMKAFRSLPGKGWYVFVAELMHSKVPGIRDVNYVHSVLVANGDYLVGRSTMEREAILHDLFPHDPSETTVSHFVVDEHTWVARSYKSGFADLYDRLSRPEHEGLVLKDPEASLELCSRANSNTRWQIKCRRATKNASF